MFVISTMACLIVFSLLALTRTVLSAPEINSPWGRIRGVDKTSGEGLPYYGYYGIRFAEPPVGDLRFKKPVPHPGVFGVFNASEYGPQCLQLTDFTVSTVNNTGMDEDCLTLNVFLPNSTEGSSQKPVMVWIHGGGFVFGGATAPLLHEPSLLVTKTDVIAVIIQYRLGVFGFLSTGSDVSPGNYGLWDQHLALQWVKTNIESFGGDKNNITIIGESAGAASVAYQILYPGSKGLFTRAILQSGAATSSWAVTRDPSGPTQTVAGAMGCMSPGSQLTEAVMECLRSKNSRELLLHSLMGGTMAYRLLSFTWVPTIDGDFVRKDPQIMMTDVKYLDTTCIRDIDVMVGVNNNEGAAFILSATLNDFFFNYTYSKDMLKQGQYDNNLLPLAVEMSLGKHSPEINDVISVAYTYPRPPANSPLPQEGVMNTFGDPSFVVPGILFARTHARLASSKNTYFYLFNHYPSFTGSSPLKGMIHGIDSPYLFGLRPETVGLYLYTGSITQEEYDLSDTFVKFLAAFAKTGDPNSVIEPKLGQPWPQFDTESQKYLSFTTNMSVGSDVFGKRASVWLDLVPHLEKIWKQKDGPTTEISPTTTYTPRWFNMDRGSAEVAILVLIVVLCVVGVILLTVVGCWCVRRSSNEKSLVL